MARMLHGIKTQTFAEYARHQRVSLQTVHNWYRKDWVKCISRGLIDVAASDEIVAEARGPLGPGDKRPGAKSKRPAVVEGSASWTRAEAARVERNYAAKKRMLEYDLQCGKLVQIEDAIDEISAKLAVVRSKLLSLGVNLAPRLTARHTPSEIKALIDSEVVAVLRELTAEISNG